MKKIFVLAMIMVFVLSLSVCADTKWQNSLKPVGDSVSVELIKDGVSRYTIVIPENSGVNENLSSKDLAEFLEKIYSAEFKIAKDSENINGKFISLGDTKFLKENNIDVPELNKDGYAIIEKDGNIYITGGFRGGSLNGVYALLEEDLGCRWYTLKHDERIPKAENGNLSFVPRSYSPQFLTRHVFYPDILEVSGWDIWYTYLNKERPFMRKNRMILWDPNGGAHTVFVYVPVSLFEKHPDWFSMKDGERKPQQLCFSNEAMYYYLLQSMKKEMETYHKDTFMVSPMDGISLCECPECTALAKKEGTNMAAYLKCMNRIAEELEKDYPELTIQLLAYLDYVKPPKTIKPRKNIEIMVCSDCCDWIYPLCTLRESKAFSKIMDDWTGQCSVITWNYASNYDHLIMPNPNLTVISEDIKQMKDWGVDGAFLQGIGNHSGNIQASGRMKAWVWTKLLWDPSLDVLELLKDFCYGYFGEEIGDLIYEYEKSLVDMYEKAHAVPHNANEPVTLTVKNGLPVYSKYYKDNEGVAFDGGIRWSPDVKMYTPEWVNHSKEIMDKALALCKTDEDREKVLYMRTNILYLILCQKLGYFRLGSDFLAKPELSREEKEALKPLFEEINSTLTGYGTDCIAEIGNNDKTKENLMNKWKEILY